LSSETPRLFRPGTVGQSLGIYLPTAAAYRLVGLARGIILAWLMTEREFGLFQITLLATNVLLPLCSAGLSDAMARYVPQYETRHSLRPFLVRAVPFALLAAAVFCTLLFLVTRPLTRLIFASFNHGVDPTDPAAGSARLTQLVLATTLVLAAYFLLQAVLRGLRLFLALSLLELTGSVLFTVAAVVVACSGYRTAEAVMLCLAATHLVTITLFGVPLWRVIRRAQDQTEPLPLAAGASAEWLLFNQMIRFSVWAALAAVLWQAMQYYPMWYLQKVQGPEVTAVYGSVRLITQAVLIGSVSVVFVVQTSVTKTWEALGRDPADRQLLLAFKATALLMLLGCVILAVGAPVIMRLFPRGYAYGAAVFPLALLFFLIGGQLAFLAIHFILIEKTRYLFGLWAIGLAGNGIFAAWLVRPDLEPSAALSAAAWAGVLGASAAMAAGLFFIRFARRPLDAGSVLVIAAAYALALPGYGLVAIIVALLLLAGATNAIFNSAEKQRMRDYVVAGRTRIRAPWQ